MAATDKRGERIAKKLQAPLKMWHVRKRSKVASTGQSDQAQV